MPSTFAMVPLEAARDDRLSKIQLRVLLALCGFRNSEHEEVWPSRATLSDRCGYSEQTISRATTDLCRLGWLQKTGKGGYSRPCSYRITPPDLSSTSTPETVSEPDTVSELETVSELDTKRCPNRAQNGVRTRQGHRTDQEQTRNQTSARVRTGKRDRQKRPLTIDSNTGGFFDRLTNRSWAE
jgi:DNA-binding transcriptional MocR family regulator